MIDPERVEALAGEWEAALAEAGYESRAIRLYPFAGEESPEGSRAFYFRPGQRFYLDAKFPDELGGQIQDANEHLDHHRIAVWVDAPTPVLGAKLRHELEHAVGGCTSRTSSLKAAAKTKGRGSLRWHAKPVVGRSRERTPRSGDRIAIAAYLGSGDAFDQAVGEFADVYADLNERDFHSFSSRGD